MNKNGDVKKTKSKPLWRENINALSSNPYKSTPAGDYAN